MARPSVADARREQIIEATLQTIAKHGISSTTLDRIATTAGMSRGHVRHFVGNRDALLIDAARWFYTVDTSAPSILPEHVSTLMEALDYLFGSEFTSSTDDNAIVLGFVELSRTSAEIAQVLSEVYLSTEQRLLELIRSAHPAVSAQRQTDAATAVLTAVLGSVFMEDFNQDPDRPARARRSIDGLLASL